MKGFACLLLLGAIFAMQAMTFMGVKYEGRREYFRSAIGSQSRHVITFDDIPPPPAPPPAEPPMPPKRPPSELPKRLPTGHYKLVDDYGGTEWLWDGENWEEVPSA